jgi:integrase
MAKTNLRLVAPNSELRTVTLRRHSNRDMGRDREHLIELEVERLMKVAKGNRHGQRDVTMILIGFRHGLRVSELCDLRWSSIEFETGSMHVRRAKGGQEATHPLLDDELRALRERRRPLSSPRSGVDRSPRPALRSCSPAPATKPRLGSRSILTCSGTPAATRWPTRASIPEPSRPILAIAPSIQRRATRRWPRVGSKTFGSGCSASFRAALTRG